ncbi:MAG: glutamate-5-semialdehyde dehydrogenase [bacterium]
MKRVSVLEKARRAREAALVLAGVSSAAKNRALRAAASEIRKRRADILAANSADVRDAEKLVAKGAMTKALLKRLALNYGKIEEMARGIEAVAALPDPVGATLDALELDAGLNLYRIACPIGVIGAIFESRPDVVPQVASLCVKSGNAVILKGGSEAARSNLALAGAISAALDAAPGMPPNAVQLIETRAEVRSILELDDYVDLLVPRGGKDFIRRVMDNTNIPVIGHADGVCHVYVDERADIETALKVCFDAKVQYPAVCNAMETLLVHEKIAARFLPPMVARLRDAGVQLRACPASRKIVRGLKPATEKDWSAEYLDLVLAVRVVASLEAAVEHINRYGSRHTDAIVTSNPAAARRFLDRVDSACVFVNASTRFSDGYRFGKGAEIGISTGKTHARGPVGMEGLLIYKYVLIGKGQTVAEYTGARARRFTHRPLKKNFPPPGGLIHTKKSRRRAENPHRGGKIT